MKKNDLPYLYSIATIGSSFVIDIPILWDNSANKYFDTLAAHRPIVINHQGWQVRDIEQNNFGYVLPPVVTEQAASDFVEYMNNEELLKVQGENAYRNAIEKYSLYVAVEKYLELFRRI